MSNFHTMAEFTRSVGLTIHHKWNKNCIWMIRRYLNNQYLQKPVTVESEYNINEIPQYKSMGSDPTKKANRK